MDEKGVMSEEDNVNAEGDEQRAESTRRFLIDCLARKKGVMLRAR